MENDVPHKKRKIINLILRYSAILLFFAPFPLGAAERAAPQPAAQDKCAVCGMFVAKYPNWVTVLRFQDGSHLFFDGAKDMFKYLLDPRRYGKAKEQKVVAAVFVKDYYGLAWIDGRQAWYVLGSDVLGPMGNELIAFETEAAAKEFLKDHKGKKIIRYADVTHEVIKNLGGHQKP